MAESYYNQKAFGQRAMELMVLSTILVLLCTHHHLASALTVQTLYPVQNSRVQQLHRYRQHLPLHPNHHSAYYYGNTDASTRVSSSTLYQSQRGSHGHSLKEGESSWWSPSEENSSKYKVRRRVKSVFQSARGGKNASRLQQSMTSENNNNNNKNSSERTTATSSSSSSWSRPVEKSHNGLGVSKRVKAVLEKARSRTGVSNASEESAAPGLWIAESASIGGLAEASDLIIKPRQKENGSSASINGARSTTNGASSVVKATTINDLEVKRNDYSSTTATTAINGASRSSNSSDLDGLRADIPTPPIEPLPFKLPKLSEEQLQKLRAGERVQEQSKMGREGSGFVVVDVKAPAYVTWECLLDFEAYPELIKTVRSMEMFTSDKLTSGYHAEKPLPQGSTRQLRHYGIPSVSRAKFVLSKFKLNIAAIHNYRPHPDGHYMVFNLDPDCTNIVLQNATGIWYVESNPDGKGEVRFLGSPVCLSVGFFFVT